MKKPLLSACLAAAAFWITNADAMLSCPITTKCVSSETCSDVNRWELGNFLRDGTYPRLTSLTVDFRECDTKLESLPKDLPEELRNAVISQLCTLPWSIGDLTGLENLSVKDNGGYSSLVHLEKLPDSIENLISLRRLNLEGCSWLVSLPESIENLKNLESLDLRKCSRLTSVPWKAILNLPKLKYLDVEEGIVPTSYRHMFQEVFNNRYGVSSYPDYLKLRKSDVKMITQ